MLIIITKVNDPRDIDPWNDASKKKNFKLGKNYNGTNHTELLLSDYVIY